MITRNLPPLTGGIERLNHHICQELTPEFDVFVCGPRGGEDFLPDISGYAASAPAPLWRFLTMNTWQSIAAARSVRPDIVYSGSGLTAPAAWLAGRFSGAPVITYLHGLDIVTRHPLYRALFIPAIRASTGILVNSSNTRRLAEANGMIANRINILHPGVELPDLNMRNTKALAFRQRIDAADRPILLSVGRLTSRKGVPEFITNSLLEIVGQVPNVLFLVIGEEPRDAVSTQDKGMAERIREAARGAGLENNVRLLGRTDDETLSGAYFASQLHVFPVLERKGDVEGFGMVAVEAAAHGLPTIAFAAGGVPDAIADGVSGRLVEPGSYGIMSEQIIAALRNDSPYISPESCAGFASHFSWKSFGANLRSLIRDALDSKH